MSKGSPRQRLRQDCELPLVVPAVAPSLPLGCEWAHSQPEVEVTTMQVGGRARSYPAPSSPSRVHRPGQVPGARLVPAAGPV